MNTYELITVFDRNTITLLCFNGLGRPMYRAESDHRYVDIA